MLYLYNREGKRLDDCALKEVMESFLWADFSHLDLEQQEQWEKKLDITIPTQAEINDIEVSTRLYVEKKTLYMTISLVVHSETDQPELQAVTLILRPLEDQLLSVRYCDPKAFQTVRSALEKNDKSYSSLTLFCFLLDAMIERIADYLEEIERTMIGIGRSLFHTTTKDYDLKQMLQKIGKQGDRISIAHESLVTLNRMLSFTQQNLMQMGAEYEASIRTQLTILIKDVTALNDHTTFLSNKVSFLLDASLGLINIEQNQIIKILSVGAVIFAAPTLVASIYGMNFRYMPELEWTLGYPWALLLMTLFSYASYRYCRKKWIS